jgi:AbrB family looped-hinge helix DNA binding protein
MPKHIVRVTAKGQVTIPRGVRRLLDIRPGDRVMFRVADGRVELLRAPMSLEETFGAVRSVKRPMDLKEIAEVVDKERAERWLTSRGHERIEGPSPQRLQEGDC